MKHGLTRPRRPRASPTASCADQDWARDKLAPMAGRVFSLAVGPLSASWSHRRRRHARGRAGGRRADLKLALSPLSLPAFLADPSRWSEFVREDGDAELGGVLKELARTLPWFVEETFAKALGPIAGPARRRRRPPPARVSRVRRATGWPTAPAATRATRPGFSRAAATRGACGDEIDEVASRASTRSRNASRRSRRACARFADVRSSASRRPPHAARRHARQVQPAAAVQRPEARAPVPAARRAPRASRSCGSPGRRARASRRSSRATSRRASCPGLWFQADPGDADPATFFHYVRVGGGATRRAARRARRRGAAAFAAEYAGDLPAFTRRFMREFFALFPAGLDARRRQLPRAQGRRPRGASRSPTACARSRRA